MVYTREGGTETKTKTTTIPSIETTAIETKRGGRKVVKDVDTATYTKRTKMKGSGKKGKGKTIVASGFEEGIKKGEVLAEGVRKSKIKYSAKDKDLDLKTKKKYSKEGDLTKKKVTRKEGDVVTKTITKGDKTRVKTRKKGGTGLGSWAKKQLAKRALKRSAKKAIE